MKNENEDVDECALVAGITSESGGPVEVFEPLAFAAGVSEVLEALREHEVVL